MNKSFLTEVFGETDGYVYEYVGTVPEGIDPESIEMATHVTLDFLKGHGDNLLATRVVQFPYQNHRIMLYAKSDTDVNTSDEFLLVAHLVPDVVVPPVVEETQQEETQQSSESSSIQGLFW